MSTHDEDPDIDEGEDGESGDELFDFINMLFDTIEKDGAMFLSSTNETGEETIIKLTKSSREEMEQMQLAAVVQQIH